MYVATETCDFFLFAMRKIVTRKFHNSPKIIILALAELTHVCTNLTLCVVCEC